MKYYSYYPLQIATQLRDQLASEKRKLGFFFGAGTSMAVGLPGVQALTKQVEEKLKSPYKELFTKIKASCDTDNIEVILNKVRTVRELLGESEEEEVFGINGKTTAQKLDVAVCTTISEIIKGTPSNDTSPHSLFASWIYLNQKLRLNPIEIFTANYDLLIEEALESKRLPYFDGFVGSLNPYLIPECVEAENNKIDQASYIPSSWLRLWKLHGSINWFLAQDLNGKKRITRNTNRPLGQGDELMIYPSKQKYDESRRLPFLVFQDRLRKFLSSGEVLFIVNGYSFNDDHLNEILFQALRSNKRLAITALLFGDFVDGKLVTSEKVLAFGEEYPNLSIIGPDKCCIGGVISKWDNKEPELQNTTFWDEEKEIFTLGDFKAFSSFLKWSYGITDGTAEERNTTVTGSTDEEMLPPSNVPCVVSTVEEPLISQ